MGLINMIQYFLNTLPIIVALVLYFVRLEVKLAVMSRDIQWIKTTLDPCRPQSHNPTD